jgi:hypothetical protein
VPPLLNETPLAYEYLVVVGYRVSWGCQPHTLGGKVGLFCCVSWFPSLSHSGQSIASPSSVFPA